LFELVCKGLKNEVVSSIVVACFRYGNYVVQTALKVAAKQEVELFSLIITNNMEMLRQSLRQKWVNQLQAASFRVGLQPSSSTLLAAEHLQQQAIDPALDLFYNHTQKM